VLRQTVPSAGGGNRKGPITDSGQPCTTDSQDDEEVEHSSPGLEIGRALELIGEVKNKRKTMPEGGDQLTWENGS